MGQTVWEGPSLRLSLVLGCGTGCLLSLMGLRTGYSEGWKFEGGGQTPAMWSGLRTGGAGTLAGGKGWEMGKCELWKRAGGGS